MSEPVFHQTILLNLNILIMKKIKLSLVAIALMIGAISAFAGSRTMDPPSCPSISDPELRELCGPDEDIVCCVKPGQVNFEGDHELN